MSTHSDVERKLLAFLQKRGVPESAIVCDPEYKSPSGHLRARPDVALTDADFQMPVAIVEVKSGLKPEKEDRIRAQVESYATLFSDVPTYLAVEGPEPDGLTFFRFDRETKLLVKLEAERFPTWGAMLAERITARQAAIAAAERERRETGKEFSVLCYGLAIASLLLVAADVWAKEIRGFELLTTPRLGLIGAIVVLPLLPFVQKFKGLGIEVERLSQGSSGKTPENPPVPKHTKD